jgi:hypothetical protein
MRVRHGTRIDLERVVEYDPRLAGMDVRAVTYYGFIRNPFDRFFSAANYLKQFPLAMGNMFPEKFPEDSIPIPIAKDDFRRKLTLNEWNTTMTQEQRDKIRNLSAEDFLNIPVDRLGTVMSPLTHWFMYGVEGLRFDDFENETRRLISLFGGDSTVKIPKSNASDDFPASVKYEKTPDLYFACLERYREDYFLLDQYGMEH